MNTRLARAHVKMLPSGGKAPANWGLCSVHGIPYPPTSLCSSCCPPDPAAPRVGMLVLIDTPPCCGDVRQVSAANFIVYANGATYVFPSNSWLVDVVPDFVNLHYTAAAVKVKGTSSNWPTINPPLSIKKCCDCSKINPYPDDNDANCDYGWRCSSCRIIRDMQ
jgi:hypothetical protein